MSTPIKEHELLNSLMTLKTPNAFGSWDPTARTYPNLTPDQDPPFKDLIRREIMPTISRFATYHNAWETKSGPAQKQGLQIAWAQTFLWVRNIHSVEHARCIGNMIATMIKGTTGVDDAVCASIKKALVEVHCLGIGEHYIYNNRVLARNKYNSITVKRIELRCQKYELMLVLLNQISAALGTRVQSAEEGKFVM